MKKWVRKTMAVALSGALLLGASGMALATAADKDSSSNFTKPASGQTSADGAATDTNSINLIKDYKGYGATTTNGFSSPAEIFTYTITPYGVWNADGTYTSGVFSTPLTSTIPMLQGSSGTTAAGGTLTLTYSAATGAASTSATNLPTTVNLPNYPVPGDYWYKVEETAGTTAGVIYGTNSNTDSTNVSGNSHYTATYYIHVQATTPISNGTCVRNVTMHKTPPSTGASASSTAYNTASSTTYNTGTKVNDIENTYYAGDLVIKKAVTGNAGELDRYFKVTVEFTKPTGTNVNSTISYTAIPFDNTCPDAPASSSTASAQTISSGAWDATSGKASATFWIRASDTSGVTFSNIPYGVTYTVTEDLPGDYDDNELVFTTVDPSPTFKGSSLAADTSSASIGSARPTSGDRQATGSISDPNDTITITNKKDVTIDIGVITEDAPYMTLMAVCAAAAVLMVARKKRIFED